MKSRDICEITFDVAGLGATATVGLAQAEVERRLIDADRTGGRWIKLPLWSKSKKLFEDNVINTYAVRTVGPTIQQDPEPPTVPLVLTPKTTWADLRAQAAAHEENDE